MTVVLIVILTCLCLVLGFLVYRLSSYVMSIEDSLSNAIEIHERTIKTFDAMLEVPMFFDSPAVQQAANAALEDVKLCRAATNEIIQSFTKLSKNVYIIDEESEK
jgi:hypothetical protein